jgi:hypothetical protein
MLGSPSDPALPVPPGPGIAPAGERPPGGVGKTWQRGDFTQLLSDVTSRVFDVYPDSTVIYPATGMTPRSAPNAHIWTSGANEAGNRRDIPHAD